MLDEALGANGSTCNSFASHYSCASYLLHKNRSQDSHGFLVVITDDIIVQQMFDARMNDALRIK